MYSCASCYVVRSARMAQLQQRRLKREAEAAMAARNDRIDLYPTADSLLQWQAVIRPDTHTSYPGTFLLSIAIPVEFVLRILFIYPIKPPKVKFATRIFHPNVHFKNGDICLDVLSTAWSPAWTLLSLCEAILVLLGDSDPTSPLNCDAGNLLRNGDVMAFNTLARMDALDHSLS